MRDEKEKAEVPVSLAAVELGALFHVLDEVVEHVAEAGPRRVHAPAGIIGRRQAEEVNGDPLVNVEILKEVSWVIESMNSDS